MVNGDRDRCGCKIPNLLQTNEDGKCEGKSSRQDLTFEFGNTIFVKRILFPYLSAVWHRNNEGESPFYERITIKHKTPLQLSID